MFEPTPTWPNVTISQLFMWIGYNNDQIWLSRGLMNDFEQCSKKAQTWYNFTLGQRFIWIGTNIKHTYHNFLTSWHTFHTFDVISYVWCHGDPWCTCVTLYVISYFFDGMSHTFDVIYDIITYILTSWYIFNKYFLIMTYFLYFLTSQHNSIIQYVHLTSWCTFYIIMYFYKFMSWRIN